MPGTPEGDALQPSAFPDASNHPEASNSDETFQFPSDGEQKPILNGVPTMPAGHATPEKPSPQQELATRALQFLSTASPGTLGAIAVGFGAVVYLILGRMGLLIIGAFCGVLAFIAWEARNPEVSKIVRGEKAVDVLERLLLDLKNSREAASAGNDDDDENYTIKNFDDFRPETREALAALVDAIVRDYVKWWYNPIIPSDHSFPLACRKTLTSFLLAMSNHLYRKRPADAFLDLLTNSSSIIIVFLSELATAFSRLPPDCNMTAVDTIYDYLASNPDSRLASLLNQRQQNTKFKMVAEDLLGFSRTEFL